MYQALLVSTNPLRLLALIITVFSLQLLNQVDVALLRILSTHSLIGDFLPLVMLVLSLSEVPPEEVRQ